MTCVVIYLLKSKKIFRQLLTSESPKFWRKKVDVISKHLFLERKRARAIVELLCCIFKIEIGEEGEKITTDFFNFVGSIDDKN